MIYIVLDLDLDLGGWCVVSFVLDHNHEIVSPNKRRCLQVNNVIIPLSRALFQCLSTSSITPSDQYSIAVNESGGYSKISFTPSDFATCDEIIDSWKMTKMQIYSSTVWKNKKA